MCTNKTFTFEAETDTEQTQMRFWLLPVAAELGANALEAVLNGTAEVKREKWQPIEGNRWRIKAQMVSMNHTGDIPGLGPIHVNVDPDPARPSLGAIEGDLGADGQPVLDVHHPAHAWFDLNLEFTTNAGKLVTTADQNTEAPIHVENKAVTCFFPCTPYSHVIAQAMLLLAKKGQLSQPLARLAAGFHLPHPHPHPHHHGHVCCKEIDPCAPPHYVVEAHGHRGCFHVKDADGWRDQLILVGSHSGSGSPVGHDRILAYVTITNNGPQSVTLHWDDRVAGGAGADQEAALLPGRSATLVVCKAVKIVYSGQPALSGNAACGHYVVSWCCPEFPAPPTHHGG